MELFECKDYKKFVNNWIQGQPKKGRGLYKQIAEMLGLTPVTISQVFKGEKELSLEHALNLADFMSLGDMQKEYFMNLVQSQRAGSVQLKKFYDTRLSKLRDSSKDLKNRVTQDVNLTEEQKAIFYSDWKYSAVRLATAIPSLGTAHQLADSFKMPVDEINRILRFLVDVGLCVIKNGKVTMGPNRTHLEKTSPFITQRQMSWRLKSMENMDSKNGDDLYLTAPMSVSKKVFDTLRSELVTIVQNTTNALVNEEPDRLVCLNIDLFEII